MGNTLGSTIWEGITIKKLISIVVSVYNKEKFLDNCIQSIIKLNMDKSQLEAIFVDDVSTDGSYNILQRYADEYDFIRCIQLENNSGGPAEPRNIGIQEANGKYITIVDADDWLEPNGYPNLLRQMEDNQSDIGFGQCFKNRNKDIVKVANFASYKKDNGLVPYDIYKIFRGMGPWGKIFKRETVINNNIKFKNLKFAEDKFFFAELISKSKNASMTDEAVYHVNRYSDNISLVKETDDIEKANFNVEVLKDLIKMNLPEYAKKQILSRIVEMDFISRVFIKKSFLKSNYKEVYYKLFDEVESIIKEHGYNTEDFLDNERYTNAYHAYHHSKEHFEEYIKFMLYHAHSHKYIKDNIVHFKYPDKFNYLPNLTSKCVAVHNGTHSINDTLYELIKIYKKPNTTIEAVELVKLNDESTRKKLEYELNEDIVYIKTDDLQFDNCDFNIVIKYDCFEHTIVYASHPIDNKTSKFKNKSVKFELESINKVQKSPKKPSYLTTPPSHVVAIKKANLYNDVNFIDQVKSVSKGEIVEIASIEETNNNTPRLITRDGLYMSANTDIVSVVKLNSYNNHQNVKNSLKESNYLTTPPSHIVTIKKANLYKDVNFKDKVKSVSKGEIVEITSIEKTNNNTPRLITRDGLYMSANTEIVTPVNFDSYTNKNKLSSLKNKLLKH